MPTEETPRQKKQASYPASWDSRAEKSKKLSCRISRSLAWRRPLGLRPTTSTLSTSGSSRHSRSTPCPTMPVAPNRMTFIRSPVAWLRPTSGGGRDRIERYTGEGGGDIPESCRRRGVVRPRHDLRRRRGALQLVEPVRAIIAGRLCLRRGRGKQSGQRAFGGRLTGKRLKQLADLPQQAAGTRTFGDQVGSGVTGMRGGAHEPPAGGIAAALQFKGKHQHRQLRLGVRFHGGIGPRALQIVKIDRAGAMREAGEIDHAGRVAAAKPGQ